MNQKKAKAIRKAVYGEFSPKARSYTKQIRNKKETGALEADEKRTFYQAMKKLYNKGMPFEHVEN